MYSPKVHEKHIPVLYRLGKVKKKPMTYLVNEAISDYLAKVENPLPSSSKTRSSRFV